MLATSEQDVQVRQLRQLVRKRAMYKPTGNGSVDLKFYQNKDAEIVDLIKRLEGSSHLYVTSAAFKTLKKDYVL